MKLRVYALVSLLTALICVPQIGYSQKKQNKGSLLPDINPQDIEIRGQYHAHFPGLHRQPILGFNPDIQIFQVDPNRQPFMESGEQRTGHLPVSQLASPAPPPYIGLTYSEPISTYVNLGYGSYSAPIGKFWGAYKLDNASYLSANLDYSSSDGHLDNRPSSFRFLNGRAAYKTRLNKKMKLNVHGGLQNDFNYGPDFSGDGTGSSQISRIEYRGYNGGVELSRFTNKISGWKLQGNIRSFDTDFTDHPLAGSINEAVYSGSFLSRWALGRPHQTIGLKLGGRGGNYDPEARNSQNWGTLQGGVIYDALFAYKTKFHLEADAFYTTDVNDQNVYPGGLLKLNHWFGDRLKITGLVQGQPRVQSVEQLHERNRFLGFNNDLIHTYTVNVTGKASIKYYRGSKLHGGVTYSNYSDYAYFAPETVLSPNTFVPLGQAPPVPGADMLDAYRVNYADATNFKLFGGITHQLLPERFWISAEAYVQHPELSGGHKIPFEENWGGQASVSFRPVDPLTIKGWGRYVSKRHTNTQNNETIGGFFLVGGQVHVDFVDNFGAYVKLVNIADTNYQLWKGYRERPFQIYGGLTIKF